MTTAASATLPAQGTGSAFTDPTVSDPGGALLRLLTDRSADLTEVDPGHVAAAALRGRGTAGR